MRLDVSVHVAHGVQRLERVRYLGHVEGGVPLGQRVRAPRQQARQVAAATKLHYQVEVTAVLVQYKKESVYFKSSFAFIFRPEVVEVFYVIMLSILIL